MMPTVGQKIYKVYYYDRKIVERTITAIQMVKDKPDQYNLEIDFGDEYSITYNGSKGQDRYGSDYYTSKKEATLSLIQSIEVSIKKLEEDINIRKEKIKELKKECDL